MLNISYTINPDGTLTDIYGYDKTTNSPVKLDLKHDAPKVNAATLRGVPVKSHISAGTSIWSVAEYAEFRKVKNWVMVEDGLTIKDGRVIPNAQKVSRP